MNNMDSQADLRAAHINYTNLDVAKFVCALLVVFIHTDPLRGVSEIAGFYLKDVLARVAVPLFFAISGFLFFRGLEYQNDRVRNSAGNRGRLVKYVKRIAGVYLLWALIYILLSLPGWYQSGWWEIKVIRDCIISVLFKGGHYHLWYLLAIIYAMPILYIIMCLISRRRLGVIIIGLWLCECLLYSCLWIGMDRIPVVRFVSQRIPIAFDALFRAVPLLAVGACCAVPAPIGQSGRWGLKTFILLAVCAAEASVLFYLSPNCGNYSYLLGTPFLTYCGLRFLTDSRQIRICGRNAKLLRNMSLSVYCIHPFVITVITVCNIQKGLLRWLSVTLISIGIAYLRELVRRCPSSRTTC